ncbi:glycosyltransferase family 39 protein [bacterium]|nr:glycosyltransferase family 39 protein [bacterium]
MQPALALLHEHRFSINRVSEEPEFFRTPGYPLFLASIFAIFGENLRVVCVLQAILSAITVVLIYRIAERLWSVMVAWIAAGLVLLEPLQTIYTSTILTETLSTLFLILVAFFAVRILDGDRAYPTTYFVTGTVLAVSILIRPGNYYLSALLLIAFLWKFWRDSRDRKPQLFSVMVFLIPLLLIVGGWKLRNHYLVDSWRLSSVDARSIMTRAASIISRIDGIELKEARTRFESKLGRRKQTESIGDYHERMRSEGIRIIRQHPGEIIPITLHGLRKFFFGVPFILYPLHIRETVVAVTLGATLLGVFYFFCVAGILISLRSGHGLSHFLFLSICMYITLISATNQECIPRYRVPVAPILCLYAAASLGYLFEKRRKTT